MSHRWKLTPLNQEDVGTFLISGIICCTIISVFYINKSISWEDVAHACLELADGKNV